MRTGEALRWTAITGAALALLLAPTGEAAARRFQMSGTWAMRRGSVFWPLQFASSVAPGVTRTSQGSLSKGFGFPNGPVPGMGRVTAEGSAPASLRLLPGRFTGDFAAVAPIQGSLVQIATTATAFGPAQTASLAPGSGPGSFTWCPGDPGCGPSGPPQGAGPRNGRVIYRAGPSRFGGVMQMLLGGGTTHSYWFNFPNQPLQASHRLFGPMGTQHTGGPTSFVHTSVEASRVVTQPTMFSRFTGVIRYPGPRLTTMFGVTDTATGPTYFVPGTRTAVSTGFPFTTGTVFVQQTTGSSGDDFFSVMGSDARTPLGAGNLSLVAGGLSLRTSSSGPSASASFGKVWMILSPPVPSLSPAGVVAAGAFVLLAVGYALRREVGR